MKAGADPGFSEGGFGQTSAHIIWLLLLLSKSFFNTYTKKYGQDICVCFTLGGSTEPPLDPPQESDFSAILWSD